ncbi:MAG TPA: maleylacetoacetate isomerase, partial [Rhodanobacteraceae bacterium]|nr:maleylacetoacetate isomerase [Rhodanobacteraceae bacterium]
MPVELTLYSYWRSSAAYRVRIALNLKQLPYTVKPVSLLRGEQRAAEFRELNPQELIPVLFDGERVIRQSLAIIEYLDEAYTEGPPLLPVTARARARVRTIAQSIACDIHPLGNLRVQQYLEKVFKAGEAQRQAWTRHWIETGFDALEAMLVGNPGTGAFCEGDAPSMADICLVPQVYNARRFGLDMTKYPTLTRIDAACRELNGFRDAAPEVQVDAPR